MPTVKSVEPTVRAALLSMGEEFDTHDVIRHMMLNMQRDYVTLLAASNGDYPFMALHSLIGLAIEDMAAEFGLQGRQVSSPDLFGNVNNCVGWLRAPA